MIRLSIVNQCADISIPGLSIRLLEQSVPIRANWPGVKTVNVWFKDAVFGKYKTQADLAAMEMHAAEEESEEYMDATGHSEAAETESLAVQADVDREDDTGSVGGTDTRLVEEVIDAAGDSATDDSGPDMQVDSEERSDVSSVVVEATPEAPLLADEDASVKHSNTVPLIKLQVRP